jgi:hypothetical protein
MRPAAQGNHRPADYTTRCPAETFNGAHVSNDTADVIVAASTVHTMAVDAAPVALLAIRHSRIAATAGPDDRRDLIAAWRGPDTVVIDDPRLVACPPSAGTAGFWNCSAASDFSYTIACSSVILK